MKKTQIFISTYNGERHLREQLESFLALENAAEVAVLIRDDGSTDGTRDILKEYEGREGFRILYGENVGLNRSMQILFENASPECLYYAYSDQDDVWLPDKMSRAAALLDKEEASVPVLYTARSILTDKEGKPIGKTRRARRAPSFANAMVQNVCIGHTQVYNRAMLDLLRTHFHEEMFVMDHWAYLLAAAFGKIVFDDALVTLYRQHGENAIGYGHTPFAVLKNRIRRTLAGVPRAHTRQLLAFSSLCGDELSPAHAAELSRFLSARGRFFRRAAYLLRARTHRQGLFENLSFRLLYLFGGYQSK